MRYVITDVTTDENSPFYRVRFNARERGFNIDGELLFDELPQWITLGRTVTVELRPVDEHH